MYTQISDEMKKMLEADARTFLMKLQSDTFEITSGFRKIVYQGGSSGEGLAIGTTVSASVEITMEKTEHLLTGKEFAFYLGMNVDGEEEYIPMGIFKAQKPAATDWEITLKAYDRMYDAERNYASSLHYPTDTQKVMREIEKLLGISFVTEITPVSLKKTGDSDVPFAGYTIREAIGYVAGLYGKFAIFNRAGQLEFRWYESGMEIPLKKMFSFERNEQDYEVQKVVGSSDSNTSYTAGSGNHGISYSNPFLTQEIVNQIYSSKHGFSYRGGTVTFLGDCRIDPWDMLQCSDLQGNIYKIPAMQITHEIDGGLTTTITAEAEEEDVEDSFSGPATKAMERTFAELLLVNKLVATKASIEYLEANYIKTSELDAVQANIETAVITNLQGKFATIEYIKANYATIGNLSAANAKIDTLEATALTASSAEIVALKTGIADINTLMFGSASGGSLSTEFSNSVVSLIGNAQIKSAMIESIDASKITALDINTTNVKVHSEDGKSQWKDNTIQISDNQRVRVQIGKDANADYNMYVWDKSGNLMFDAIGLTEKGINRPVIRNDMVKDDANISASKLDISSLFSVINNDGSHTLKSSKIFVDADNQTLDISFKSITEKTDTTISDLKNLTSSVEIVTNTVNAHGTQLTNIQGQISSKIWQQDITTAVTSLEIGGRNLYKGTKYWNGEWIVKDGVTIAEDVAKMTAVAYPYYGTVAVKSKEQYTISLEVKSDVAHATTERGVVLLNFVDSKKQRVHASWVPGSFATEWKRINYTFNVPENDNIAALWIGLRNNSNKVVYFRYLKLEKGNKATDWTPAPEDTDSSILGLEATTKTLSTQYTSLNQTLTSLTATVNSNTTAISKKADGSTVTTLQENFTKFKQDSDTFQTSVSKTYATKTEMSSKSDKIVATFSGNGSSNPYCLLAELKISGGYVNTPIVIAIDQRSYGRAEIHILFAAAADTNPNLSSFSKTGKPTVWIVRTATSTWQLYVKKSENWDIITVTDIISPISTVAITWKCQNAASVPAGFVTATQMASYYNVDSTNGGTSGSNNLVTSGALYFTTTIANQTADKFQWLVKSGTSATDFTLTDRVATLLSDKFDITALTTFKSKAQSGTETVINGGAIKTGTITADKINVDSLQAISAKIGGFTIDNNNIASGTWGTSGSVMMCTGTDGAKSIGGSGTISGWCFTAGAKFGVTKTGSLYASDITVNGGKIDLNASSVTTAASSTTAYFRTAYSSSCYARISSGKDCSEIKIVDGNSKIFLSAESGGAFIQSYKGDELKLHYYDGYLRADEIQAKTKLTCQSFSASGSATITGNITTSGKLTATGNFELRTSGNASNLILHDDYAKYCYIRYSGARLWFLPATDSGGFELANSASLDANTGTFYATAWGSNSSRRYKENITELTESVADRLLKIKTYHFDYKKDYGSKDMYGVIAEEVDQVHKNAVLYRNGEPDAVDYTRFIPLLIKKVQMQDKKLKNLDNMVTHLIGIAMHPEKIDYNNN